MNELLKDSDPPEIPEQDSKIPAGLAVVCLTGVPYAHGHMAELQVQVRPGEEFKIGDKLVRFELVEALLKAAEPFNALYKRNGIESMMDKHPDDRPFYGVNGSWITLGDFRRLRDAIKNLKGG